MADEYILKHLQDVLGGLRICAVERKAEIMGEAINRIRKKDPTFEIPNAKEIINTRNRIIHGYDSVETEFLWGLVIRHIPELKKDIERIIADYGILNSHFSRDGQSE